MKEQKNAALAEMIYKRKSTRAYTSDAVDGETLARIRDFIDGIIPLYPEIPTRYEIVTRDKVKSMFKWLPEYAVAAFSEEKDGYLENVGFVLGKLDLFIHSLGLGSCWIGMGRMGDATVGSEDDKKFVILLFFGHPKGGSPYRKESEFNRKSLADISDRQDERLEPARLAPSSINSQPWYFSHGEEGAIHLYRTADNFLRARVMAKFNTIDTGIALSHLAVSYPDSFRYEKLDTPPDLRGKSYIGTIYI